MLTCDLGLNENMFPLNTYTYPVTRNIKVEIAVIIIITVFGVIAQLRLWKVIKERRAEEESSRQEAEREKEEAEAELGKQLEKNNVRERVEWEHMYGNGQDAKASSVSETAVADDSRRGSSGYGPSNREKGNSFELTDMTGPQQPTGLPDGGKALETVKEITSHDLRGGEVAEPRQSEEGQNSHGVKGRSHETSAPASLHQPLDAASMIHHDDSEHGAVMGSEVESPRSSRRFSRKSWMTRASWRSENSGLSRLQSQSEEALVHDDATSSVAGAVDDLESVTSHRTSFASDSHGNDGSPPDRDVSSTAPRDPNVLSDATDTQVDREETQKAEPRVDAGEETRAPQNRKAESVCAQDKKESHEHGGDSIEESISEKNNHDKDEAKDPGNPELETQAIAQVCQVESQHSAIDEEGIPRGIKLEENIEEHQAAPALEFEAQTVEGSRELQGCAETAIGSNQRSQAVTEERCERPKLDAITVESIPEQTSKVVHRFRTKEWVKQLASAETPEVEPLDWESEVDEDSTSREAAAPVDVDGLLQTALNAQPPPVVNSTKQTSPLSADDLPRSNYSLSLSAEVTRVRPRNSLQDSSAPGSLTRLSQNFSSTSFAPQQQDHVDGAAPMRRDTSTPFLTVTAPPSSARHVEATDTPRWNGPPPLLAVRENRLRNRISSTSARYDPWASASQSRNSLIEPQVTSPTFSIPEEQDENIEEAQAMTENEDDLPLSKRRAMLQRQSMRSPSAASFQNCELASSPQWSSVESNRSASTMAAWRHSVREDILSKRDPVSYQSSSPVPLRPLRPQSFWGSVEQMRAASATKVDNAIAEGMQRGSMTDLHRQAMRRMQASATRQL